MVNDLSSDLTASSDDADYDYYVADDGDNNDESDGGDDIDDNYDGDMMIDCFTSTQKSFTHMDKSPLLMKSCKI
jgi:hypothetical protein